MDQTIRPLAEMPNLSRRLNKGKMAQVQESYKPDTLKPLRAKVIENPIQEQVQGLVFPELPTQVQDILIGSARTCSGGTKPLNVDCILACYQTLPEFHTRRITSFLGCSEQNARKYLQAIRICNLFLRKIYL